MSERVLSGRYHTWEAFDTKRRFTEITLPFCEVREYLAPVVYSASTGKGNQREVNDSHCNSLRKNIESCTYTPVPGAAHFTPQQLSKVEFNEEKNSYRVVIDKQTPLMLTDAGHRVEALNRTLSNLNERLAKSTDEKEQEDINRWIRQVNSCPITFTLYFDGDAQLDFVRFQMGRPVDTTHLLSAKIQKKILTDPAYKVALETAKLLNKHDGSPFMHSVRIDSRGKAALPFKTLCAGGSSDIATSLLGLTRVATYPNKSRDAKWCASIVINTYQALLKNCPEVLEYGRVLTSQLNQGTKGSATMLIGVATCLAFRLMVKDATEPSDIDIGHLVNIVRNTLNVKTNGNFSGPAKRELLGKFAKEYFADYAETKHADLPLLLLTILSASTFAAPAIPKPVKEAGKKKTGGRKKKQQTVIEETPAGEPLTPERQETTEEVEVMA